VPVKADADIQRELLPDLKFVLRKKRVLAHRVVLFERRVVGGYGIRNTIPVVQNDVPDRPLLRDALAFVQPHIPELEVVTGAEQLVVEVGDVFIRVPSEALRAVGLRRGSADAGTAVGTSNVVRTEIARTDRRHTGTLHQREVVPKSVDRSVE